MENFKRFAKIVLIITIVLLVFNLFMLFYTYSTCKHAMKDTLSNVATIVAEKNCLEQTDVATLKKVMVSNAPIWLTYNAGGANKTEQKNKLGYINAGPTNLIQVENIEDAINNIAWTTTDMNKTDKNYSAVQLSTVSSNSSSNKKINDAGLYSIQSAPNRGTAIRVKLNANLNYRIITFFGAYNITIPMSDELTVIGMKFYKGKAKTD